jgi:hypothetical protein
MEYLHLCQVQGSSRQRYQENTGHVLYKLQFRDIVSEMFQAIELIQHQGGWLVHPAVEYRVA